MDTLEKARLLLQEIQKFGGESYIVGGAVRDSVLGITPHDVDIATNVPMHVLENNFPTYDLGKNKSFGVIGIKYLDETFEVAQFRTESDYSDGRHPDKVLFTNTLQEDVSRRDFTINALAADMFGEIIDHVGGLNDIRSRIIRTVGNPSLRFNEDHLRMIRAVRFATRFNFVLEFDTMQAIRANANKILSVSPERIWQEVWKAASYGKSFANFITLLDTVDLLRYIFPDIYIMKHGRFPHAAIHHPEGDTYSHTMKCIEYRNSFSPLRNIILLFHDVGKIKTYVYEDGKHTYHGHESAGLPIIDNVCDQYRVDNETRECMKFCTQEHMIFKQLPKIRSSKAFELYQNKFFNILKEICEADDLCRGLENSIAEWYELEKFIEGLDVKYKSHTFKKAFHEIINGGVVMNMRGIPPGPQIGNVINNTFQWILDNNIPLSDVEKILGYAASAPLDKKMV